MAGSEYYDHTTYPSQGAVGSSSAARAEFELIEAGFNKAPALAGNGGKLVAINTGGTAQEAIETTGTGSGVRATSPTLTVTGKTTPVDADTVMLGDSAATGVLRGLTWANLKTAIKTYLSGASFPIGATTASTGAFTTLSASGSVTTGATGTSGQIVIKRASDGTTTTTIGDNASDKLAITNAAGAGVSIVISATERVAISFTGLAVAGVVTPEADNTRTLGTAPLRWSTVYAGTGTINTSDANEKTPVRALTTSEINAAKALSAEIGAYKFLDAVAAKGDAAREHIGMTVQRVIEIMQAHGLNPFDYGFICYDAWADVFVEHPAIEATEDAPAVAAWTEQTQTAGNRYGFRMDELLMFISRGVEARLSALEVA